MTYSKIAFVISLLMAAIGLLTYCTDRTAAGDPRGSAYAGAAVCGSCHGDIMQAHLHSYHRQTSAPADYATLKKWISAGGNNVYYEDSSSVQVGEKQGRVFQFLRRQGKEQRSEPMDMSFGSGEKAQTYAYWKNEQLFQLPLTYFTSLHSWINSPGYPASRPYFDRVILSRCLECHASYVHKTEFQKGPLEISEKLDAGSVIYGIDCERCHGPAAAHARFHQDNPDIKEAKLITSIPSLTRQQQLDLCASCHSGNDRDIQRSLFGFKPGDTLTNFYFPFFGGGSKEPDVHGKQMQLLEQSKCFRQSTMTCISCHDGHQATAKQQAFFIAKCMDCHGHSGHALQMKTADNNCISCHMPLEPSRSLIFNNDADVKRVPYMLRTHRIAVYPAE